MKKKRTPKTTVINLLGGKQVRITKEDIVEIQEQNTLFGGGIDVVVIMRSGWQHIASETKQSLLTKIKGENKR